MTYRTTVRDGLIVINTHGEIPDGETVEVVRVAKPERKRSAKTGGPKSSSRGVERRKKAKPKAAKSGEDPFLASFGIWKDRPEWKGKSTLEIQRELRKKAMGGRSRG